MDEMTAAYSRDSTTERLYRDAERALAAVLKDENASRRLGREWVTVEHVRKVCKMRADHIVAVWD